MSEEHKKPESSPQVKMLHEELSWTVNPALLEAYRSYADALVLLDDTFASIEGVSTTTRAQQALPLLDRAANYVLAKLARCPPSPTADRGQEGWAATHGTQQAKFARVAADMAATRRAWSGSRWRESFYGSEMAFVNATVALGEDPTLNANATSFATYGRKVYTFGHVGALRGSASGPNGQYFRGVWREEHVDEGDCRGAESGYSEGEVILRMSDDGLSFDGLARVNGEDWRWDGERIPEVPPAEAYDTYQKWYATVLCLRSKARLRQGMVEEALNDGVDAVRTCMHLPGAWDALAMAALEAGDKRTATIALSELWYMREDTNGGMADAAKGGYSMPQELIDKRRQQRFTQEELMSDAKQAHASQGSNTA